MKFDIALLSSHSVGGGYYRHALARNLPDTGLAPAFIDVPPDNTSFFQHALAHYSWQKHNICNFDNSEGIRIATAPTLKRLLSRDCLILNIVRDPILKFCSIANFYSRYGLWEECNQGGRLARYSEEEIQQIFHTRFSDNQMALPYTRFRQLSDRFFLSRLGRSPGSYGSSDVPLAS